MARIQLLRFLFTIFIFIMILLLLSVLVRPQYGEEDRQEDKAMVQTKHHRQYEHLNTKGTLIHRDHLSSGIGVKYERIIERQGSGESVRHIDGLTDLEESDEGVRC